MERRCCVELDCAPGATGFVSSSGRGDFAFRRSELRDSLFPIGIVSNHIESFAVEQAWLLP